MAGQDNIGMVVRQLLLTEFPQAELSEVPGGLLLSEDACWLAVWDPEALGDPEVLIRKAQQFSKDNNRPLAGAISFHGADQPPLPQSEQLEEALYIYGFPRVRGLNRGGPEMVQVLPVMPPLVSKPLFAIEPASASPEAAQHLFSLTLQTSDLLTGPAWARRKNWLERTDVWLIYRDFEPAGILGYVPGKLFGRVVLLFVHEEQRGHGLGRELLSHAQLLGQQHGAHFTTVWTHRDGRLRYYTAKLGYSEQLSLRYYLAGAPE